MRVAVVDKGMIYIKMRQDEKRIFFSPHKRAGRSRPIWIHNRVTIGSGSKGKKVKDLK